MTISKISDVFIESPDQCRDGATRIRTYSSVFIYIIYIYSLPDVSLWAYKVRHLKVMLARFLANKKNIVLNQIREASKIGPFTAYILKKCRRFDSYQLQFMYKFINKNIQLLSYLYWSLIYLSLWEIFSSRNCLSGNLKTHWFSINNFELIQVKEN